MTNSPGLAGAQMQGGQQVMGISQPGLGMVVQQGGAGGAGPGVGGAGASGSEAKVLDKRRLQELVKEVDPLEQLDDDVEEVSTCIHRYR